MARTLKVRCTLEVTEQRQVDHEIDLDEFEEWGDPADHEALREFILAHRDAAEHVEALAAESTYIAGSSHSSLLKVDPV